MPPRPALAVGLHVSGRRAVIVGDGPLAEERRSRLTAAGAEVVVVPAADYRPELLDGATLVLCVDGALGKPVAEAARARGATTYVQDRPDLSALSLPALARRGALQLAISTEGLAPALARRFREVLEVLLESGGVALDNLLLEMARLRDQGDRQGLSAMAAKLRISGRIEIEP